MGEWNSARWEADVAAAGGISSWNSARGGGRLAAIACKAKHLGSSTAGAAGPAVGWIDLQVLTDPAAASQPDPTDVAAAPAVGLISVQVFTDPAAAALHRPAGRAAGSAVGLIGLEVFTDPVTVGLPRRTGERLAWTRGIERVLLPMPLARLLRELEGDAVGRIAIRAVAPGLRHHAFTRLLGLVFLRLGISEAEAAEHSS